MNLIDVPTRAAPLVGQAE